ncbi:MAG: hypothetical protein KC503_17405 [Myxococcales bacterium]|nr:hypothetical protein [Myxococcales bacterium]
MARSEVRLFVDGNELQASEWSIESDLLQPADAFEVTVPNPQGRLSYLADLMLPGCSVLVDDTVQMTGYVDSVTQDGQPGTGNVLRFSGRDAFGQLVDCAAAPQSLANHDVLMMAIKLAGAFVPDWIVDNEANRLKLQRARRQYARIAKEVKDDALTFRADNLSPSFAETAKSVSRLNQKRLAIAKANLAAIRATVFPRVKIEPGESIMDVLTKAAKKTGMLVWLAADGTGVIAKPHYDQAAQYEIHLHKPSSPLKDRNNVKGYSHTHTHNTRYQTWRQLGWSPNTKSTAGQGSRHAVTITDSDITLPRLKIFPRSTQSRKHAKKTIRREYERSLFDAVQLSYTVEGHTQNGLLWQIDTLCSVDDTVTGHQDTYYVTRRRFSGSLSGSQVTEVSLRRKGLLLP